MRRSRPDAPFATDGPPSADPYFGNWPHSPNSAATYPRSLDPRTLDPRHINPYHEPHPGHSHTDRPHPRLPTYPN